MERKSKTIVRAIKATHKRDPNGKDFQYIVQRPEKARICFGSAQNRDERPNTSRLAVKFSPKLQENLYPGKYFTPNEFISQRPTSTRGTVLGGRTAPRDPPIREAQAPPPNKYNIPPPASPSGPRFTGPPRFKSNCKDLTVGPGFYQPFVRKRSIQFSHSFGGRKKLIAPVTMKCRAVNPDICEKCKEKPEGDYWAVSPQLTWEQAKQGLNADTTQSFLCQPCYENERSRPKSFSKADLARFKKVRGCSQVHFHDGCEAKIFLVPPSDIEKIQGKEAYLAMYFP